ncbi:MAG: GumC family protein [Muribaculaceae bacterium]
MADIKSQAVQGSNASNKKEILPLSDVFTMTLRHWPWIILSVVICVGFATLYILRTPKVYTRSAEIQIKDNEDGAAPTEFKDLGLFQSSSNVQDEIAILDSRDLMEEVVRRLNLDNSYYREGFFHDSIAYGTNLPIDLTIKDIPEAAAVSLKIKVNKSGNVTLSDIKMPKKELPDKTYTGMLNDTIMTAIGKMVVKPTSEYKKGKDVDLIFRKTPFESACKSFSGRLGVSLTDKDGNVITLTMADQSQQRADDVLSMLITVYNESWIRDKNQITVSTSNFIDERLGVIEDELGNVDSDISAYKSANLIPDVQAAASMYMEKSQKAEEEILKLNNMLQMMKDIRSYLNSHNSNNQLMPSMPANGGVSSQGITTQINDYNKRVLQRNALAEKSSEQNPIVIQLDGQIAAQRKAIMSTVDNEIADLSNKLKTYRGSEAQTTSRIATNPTQAKNLLSVERQQKVKEELYLFLLQKREENELSQSFTAYNTKIVNRPGPSDVPPSPRKMHVLGLAFLLGLAIPFGVTYVRESNNTKLRGRKDIKQLKVPFLGEIPQDPAGKGKKAKDSDRTILVKAGARDIVNEAFRVLRTNVEFLAAADGSSSVIAVTSFNPGSGKSYITVNLAMSIVLKDKKVLVIDGDMRRGSASAYVDSPSKGLSNYLSGAISDVNSVIVKSKDCERLNVLPVGSVPPNPSELLGLPKFAEMLEALKSQYDFIFIDCPPIEMVADTQIIDRYADRTFFIIRAGLLERAMIPEVDNLYESKKYKNMALILNGTSNLKGRSGYGYGYGYGNGYKYGK